MAITTTDSMKQYKPRLCNLCGHPISLGRQLPDGGWACAFGCPDGPAPAPEEALIAHNPLDRKHGVSSDHVKRLQQKGVKFTLSRRTRKETAEVHEMIGDSDWTKPMRPVEDLMAEQRLAQQAKGVPPPAYPLAPGEEEPFAPASEGAQLVSRPPRNVSGARPLGAGAKKAFGKEWNR